MLGWIGQRPMAIDIPERYKSYLKQTCPQLIEHENFEYSSEVDFNYDCLSWAIGAKYLFQNVKYGVWPDQNIADDTAAGWNQVLQKLGFEPCQDTNFVPGFEKIAIFETAAGELHACRNDRLGIWKSKLGDMGPDIDHFNLECLEPTYVKVVYALQKWRGDWLHSQSAE